MEGNVVIFADFNMPDIDWERNWSSRAGDTMLLDLLGDQIVRESTHRDGNTLDLVIPSSAELVAGVETVGSLSPTADHFMQVTTLVGPARDPITMEDADYGAIKTALEVINWEEELQDKPGQECLDLFYLVVKREKDVFKRSLGERAIGIYGRQKTL